MFVFTESQRAISSAHKGLRMYNLRYFEFVHLLLGQIKLNSTYDRSMMVAGLHYPPVYIDTNLHRAMALTLQHC